METPKPKQATEDDIPHILKLAKEFHKSSPYKDIPIGSDEVLAKVATSVLSIGTIFFTDNGFIAGVLTPLLFNPDVLVASEVAWWSEDGQGAELMDAFEEWGREHGASIVQYAALNNDKLIEMDKKYTEYGYQLFEVSYTKAL